MDDINTFNDLTGSTNQYDFIYEDNSLWLNQNQIADFFSIDRTTILRHIKNIYKTKELNELQTSKYIVNSKKEGNRVIKRNIIYYNFDLIISVGFRVKSKRGTIFRKWINSSFKDLISQKQDFIKIQNIIQNANKSEKSDYSYLYLMLDNSSNNHKIGVSKNPKLRERTLQAQKPDINLIFWEKFHKNIAYKIERNLHKYYDSKRTRGEWFDLTEKEIETFYLKIKEFKKYYFDKQL